MFFFAFGLFSKCFIPGILATLTGSYVCLALVISKISLPGIGSAMKVGISFFRSKSLIFCMYQNLPGSTSSFQGGQIGIQKSPKRVRKGEKRKLNPHCDSGSKFSYCIKHVTSPRRTRYDSNISRWALISSKMVQGCCTYMYRMRINYV